MRIPASRTEYGGLERPAIRIEECRTEKRRELVASPITKLNWALSKLSKLPLINTWPKDTDEYKHVN